MPETSRQFSEYQAWKGWKENIFGQPDPVQARYFEAEFSAAGVDNRAPISLLEIGFGNAVLATWARAIGWAYTGTELDPDLVARARAAGIDAHQAKTPIATFAPDCGYDLVVAFDVLEHLTKDEIAGLLEAVRPHLKLGGRLIARFPSGDSPFSGAIQHGDVTHKTEIGSGMIEQIAIANGYNVLQVRGPAFPLTGLGIRRMLRRAPIKGCRALIGSLCRLIYFDNRPRVIEPNILAVLQPAAGFAERAA